MLGTSKGGCGIEVEGGVIATLGLIVVVVVTHIVICPARHVVAVLGHRRPEARGGELMP